MQHIGDDEGSWRFKTRRNANCVRVGDQDFVRILVPDIRNVFWIMAIDRADKNTARDAQRFVANGGQEFFGRQNFASLDAVNVRHNALNLIDFVLSDPIRKIDGHCLSPVFCRPDKRMPDLKGQARHESVMCRPAFLWAMMISRLSEAVAYRKHNACRAIFESKYRLAVGVHIRRTKREASDCGGHTKRPIHLFIACGKCAIFDTH